MRLQFMLVTKSLNKKSVMALFLAITLFISTIEANARNSSTNNAPLPKSSQWQWKLINSSMYQSNIGIYLDSQLIRQYVVDCNLDNQENDELSDESSQIEKVLSKNNHKGLLLVTCIHGAHSKLIEIYDPHLEQTGPVFTKYGAYSAGWEKRNGKLFIYYDQVCKSRSSTCQQYEKIESVWPPESNIHRTSDGKKQ